MRVLIRATAVAGAAFFAATLVSAPVHAQAPWCDWYNGSTGQWPRSGEGQYGDVNGQIMICRNSRRVPA
ncbi:hypothetical protein [Streptosporangium minutum]|uniref:hypothetical protein n=1 Tax=Streptosporangium minutum TaxID=569862 RepID=UPI0010552DC7|nr:hypothetical protein [Streptosporangium minutum]